MTNELKSRKSFVFTLTNLAKALRFYFTIICEPRSGEKDGAFVVERGKKTSRTRV